MSQIFSVPEDLINDEYTSDFNSNDYVRIILDIECDDTSLSFSDISNAFRSESHPIRYDGFMANARMLFEMFRHPHLFKTAQNKRKHSDGDEQEEENNMSEGPTAKVEPSVFMYIENVPSSTLPRRLVARRIHFILRKGMKDYVLGFQNFFRVLSDMRTQSQIRGHYKHRTGPLSPWFCSDASEVAFVRECVQKYTLNHSEHISNHVIARLRNVIFTDSIFDEMYSVNQLISYYSKDDISHLAPEDIDSRYLDPSNYSISGRIVDMFPDINNVYQCNGFMMMRYPDTMLMFPLPKLGTSDEEIEARYATPLDIFRAKDIAESRFASRDTTLDEPPVTMLEQLTTSVKSEWRLRDLNTLAQRREFGWTLLTRFENAVHAPPSSTCESVEAIGKFIRDMEQIDASDVHYTKPWYFNDIHFAMDGSLSIMGNYMAYLCHEVDRFPGELTLMGNFEALFALFNARDTAFDGTPGLRDNHFMHGLSETGKSTCMAMVKACSVPGTTSIVAHTTGKAATAAVNKDYMTEFYDEMPDELVNGKDQKTGNPIIKTAMTTSQVRTKSIVVEDGLRKSRESLAKMAITYIISTNERLDQDVNESVLSRGQCNYLTRTRREDKSVIRRMATLERQMDEHAMVDRERKIHCLIAVTHMMITCGVLMPPCTGIAHEYMALYATHCHDVHSITFSGRRYAALDRRFTSMVIREAVIRYFFVEWKEHYVGEQRRWTVFQHLFNMQNYLVGTAEQAVFVISLMFKNTFHHEEFLVLKALYALANRDQEGNCIPGTNDDGMMDTAFAVINSNTDKVYGMSSKICSKIKQEFGVIVAEGYVIGVLRGLMSREVSVGSRSVPIITKGGADGTFQIPVEYVKNFGSNSTGKKCLSVIARLLYHRHVPVYRMLTGITYNYLEDIQRGHDKVHYGFYVYKPVSSTESPLLHVALDSSDDESMEMLAQRTIRLLEDGVDHSAVRHVVDHDIEKFYQRSYMKALNENVTEIEIEGACAATGREKLATWMQSNYHQLNESYPEQYIKANQIERGMRLTHQIASGQRNFQPTL